LHSDALVDSMGTANLVYGETTNVAEPRLNPYLAFSVTAMGNAGLSCLGVFELAAAIQPLRGTTPAQAGIIPTAAIFSSEPKGREFAV